MKHFKRAIGTAFILACSIIYLAVVPVGCTRTTAVYKPKENEWKVDSMIKNPIILPEKPGDGAADPFIMRYNGWYYLYTTGVVNIWRSKDLANWSYVGTANDAKPLSAAYAPEVYYWNGKFYMYTSPAGNGHYILEADEPTGPFVRVTDNLGLSIDGSIFIDDDGSWHFTRADSRGIIGHEMSSPTEIDPKGVNLGAYMGHWTEGPMIIKRNGRYFMTYTGNHFQSRGYRVNYCVSEEGPFGPYNKPSDNPILINDMDISRSLGHSSFVYGPDLDSMYIAYHSYTVNISPRVLNIDRLSFNGSRMYVNGPTWFEMPVADMPSYALWPEDDPASQMDRTSLDNMESLLSKEETGDTFTAEWNLSGGNGDTGVVLCKNDDGDYIRILWLKDSSSVVVEKHEKGAFRTLGSFELPNGFRRDALHTVKVQYCPELLDVYFDGMHKLEYKNPGPGSGRIGYVYEGSQPSIGFTGFSDAYKGSGDYKAVKPIPGRFDAVHHLPERNKGNGGSIANGTLAGDINTLILEKKGAWASYRVNAEKDGTYGIALQVSKSTQENIEVEVLEDGQSLGVFSLKELSELRRSTGESKGIDRAEREEKAESEIKTEADFVKIPLGTISLKAGMHQLALRLAGGENLEILSVEIYGEDSSALPAEYDLTGWHRDMKVYGHGSFSFDEKGMGNADREDMKMTVGSRTWTDYIIDVEVTPGRFGMGRSGLLFRASNESYHPHQNNNALQGYFAGMDSDGIFLKRMNYEDTKEIAKVPFKAAEGVTYSMRVEARGNSIKVYVNDMDSPVIEYCDPDPFLFGRVGVWSFKDVAVYKNLKIAPLQDKG